MATLTQYVAKNTRVGQKQEVKVRKVVWLTIGRGEVHEYSDFSVGVDGQIKFLNYSGPLKIYLTLKDEQPAAVSGPCRLQLNKVIDENARYEARADELFVAAVFNGTKQNIAIRRTNNGTQTECSLTGQVNETVHLDPL